MQIDTLFLILSLFIGTICFSLSLYLRWEKKSDRKHYVKNFEDYTKTLEHFMGKSYDIIYKDRILIFSIEATKIDDKELRIVLKDYLYLTLKLLGPTLTEEYVALYGNRETLYFIITEYFNTRFEDDEIRKDSMETMMNEE